MAGQHFTRSQTRVSFRAAGVLPITVHQNEALCLLGGEPKRTGPEGRVIRTLCELPKAQPTLLLSF